MSEPVRIVITGAPASGKTKFFERLRGHPSLSDFLFFEELARRLLVEDAGYRERPADFHREIYRRQRAREDAAPGRSFITDRGTADAFAFHPETAAEVGTTPAAEYRRYTGVIQLGTAAALGPEYYQADEVRIEPIAAVLALERQIRSVWERHPGYQFVPARESVDEKYAVFVEIVCRLAGKTPV